MKKILFILIILFAQITLAYSIDSLRYDKQSKAIESLKIDNQLLKQKVDVLNAANDKFLTVTYSTIGFCLMLILGIGILNTIQSHKINNEKLENIRTSIKSELSKENESFLETLFDSEKRKNEVDLNKLKITQLENEIKIQIMSCVSIPEKNYRDINTESFTLVSMIRITFEYYKLTHKYDFLKKALEFLYSYIDVYFESIQRDSYEKEMIIRAVKEIQIDDLNELSEKIINRINKN